LSIDDYEIFDQYNVIVFDYLTIEWMHFVYLIKIVCNFQLVLFDKIALKYYLVKYDYMKIYFEQLLDHYKKHWLFQ
jgi:hypothetical protein